MRGLVLALLLWPGLAAATILDCTAARVCVAGLDVVCDGIEVVYSLDPGTATGDKLVLTTGEGERSYEFRRLPEAEGVSVQGAGGALEPGQGAGALTVFEDMRFLLSRHALLPPGSDPGDTQAVAISIHGSCEERQ